MSRRRVHQPRRRWERAALLVALGFLLINPPLLLIANKPILLWGIPVLYLWLAVVWLGLIIASVWVSRRLSTS